MFFISKLKKLIGTTGVSYVVIALLTAIASEIKVIPFNGENFRFGLGSIAFFLLILIRPSIPLIRTGFITGLTVVCFRLISDLTNEHISFFASFQNHFPAFLYYLLFAIGFSIIKIESYKASPLFLGAWAFLFEFIGNGAEHLMRYLLSTHVDLGMQEWALVGGMALFRSFFVVGLYSMITVSEQKKQVQEMLGVGADLYAESLYLQKSLDHIEQITAASHELYRKLKKENLQELSVQALLITQEIHEVKKDTQRILSGISSISTEKRNNVRLLSEVLSLVVTANEKYSVLLRKKITFHISLSVDFETTQQIPLLALLNNLTANAVESIEQKGEIELTIFEEMAHTCFILKDTGEGIQEEDLPIIFEAGYTTKFNNHGVAATGIGLSHVQHIIQTLEGRIQVESSGEETFFRIQIPTKKLRK
ncbi:MAG TPA: sensor histidine kinase [Sporosarcina psychrophila]|uniref:histidine kinase n=1 Tax=Sporosarcina psychrophila TaxID=1476 RepID=A0A921FX12_SPOPS|nr:sensor histidine kinase [Sporosarcina psychrophila]